MDIWIDWFDWLYLITFSCRYWTDRKQSDASCCVYRGHVQRRSGSDHRLPGSSRRHQRGSTNQILLFLFLIYFISDFSVFSPVRWQTWHMTNLKNKPSLLSVCLCRSAEGAAERCQAKDVHRHLHTSSHWTAQGELHFIFFKHNLNNNQ